VIPPEASTGPGAPTNPIVIPPDQIPGGGPTQPIYPPLQAGQLPTVPATGAYVLVYVFGDGHKLVFVPGGPTAPPAQPKRMP
jgi:hypothetical protein